jgi:Tol biopolymer transport system component
MVGNLAVALFSLTILGCTRPPDDRSAAPADLDSAVNLGPVVNGPTFDGGPSLAADGLALYFASDRAGGNGDADLWIALRSALEERFDSPRNLGPTVNSSANESAPDVAADGLALVFDSDRPGGFGLYDLWIASRYSADEPFGRPENLGAGVNTAASEGHPHLSPDGLTLYFQGRGLGGHGDADLWMASRAEVSDAFGAAVNLGSAVNSRYFDGEPSVSADGLTLFFSSDRPGGFGERDLWIASRARSEQPFGSARHLGPGVNSTAEDVTPSLSRDATVLYFMSNRPGGVGSLDLWMARLR